jgi:hypothetical protein
MRCYRVAISQESIILICEVLLLGILFDLGIEISPWRVDEVAGKIEAMSSAVWTAQGGKWRIVIDGPWGVNARRVV